MPPSLFMSSTDQIATVDSRYYDLPQHKIVSTVERQKGLTICHLHTQLDPFASKLMIYLLKHKQFNIPGDDLDYRKSLLIFSDLLNIQDHYFLYIS